MPRVVFALSLATMTACAPLEDDALDDAALAATDGLISNAHGRFFGELPTIGAFEQEVASVAIVERPESQPGVIELRLHAFEPGAWGMVYAGFPESMLVEGEPISVSTFDGLGCSGPNRDTLDFDELPSRMEVQFDRVWFEGERVPRYTVDAVFSEGWVHGTVVGEPDA